MVAPVSSNEAVRLRLLGRHRILDTAPDAALNDLARLASVICQTPIALVSLIDEHRQWFKAVVGLNVRETPRDQAFCAHAILDDQVMVVEDAAADTRFSSNPLVTGNPRIRFYAGAPLLMREGVALGTLCVIDRTPRQLTAEQLDALQVLRQAVVAQLELRRALADLAGAEMLLPMCAWCRDVKDHDGPWSPLHDYVMKSQQVTHGMCPECASRF